jgi:hypothetical protein
MMRGHTKESAPMFIFNRSFLAVFVALMVPVALVLLQSI